MKYDQLDLNFEFVLPRGLTRCHEEIKKSSDLIIVCVATTPNESPDQERIYARTIPKRPIVLDHQGYSS